MVAARLAAIQAARGEQVLFVSFPLYSFACAVVAVICTGGLCGLVNGALVSYLRVVPFIVTLGTMQLYLGLAKQIASETTVPARKNGSALARYTAASVP